MQQSTLRGLALELQRIDQSSGSKSESEVRQEERKAMLKASREFSRKVKEAVAKRGR